MKKKISFEVETGEENNERIKSFVRGFIIDNFRLQKEPEIKIEDIIENE